MHHDNEYIFLHHFINALFMPCNLCHILQPDNLFKDQHFFNTAAVQYVQKISYAYFNIYIVLAKIIRKYKEFAEYKEFSPNASCLKYGSCVQHLLSLPSIYKPCFMSIPFLLNTIWDGEATTMKTWIKGDHSVNIPGRIMVIVHCPSLYCHLSINQVPLQSLLYFSRYGPTGNKMVMGR